MHFEEGAFAFAAHLQVIRGVDDLDAEVQRLEEELPGEPGLNDLLRQDGRGPPERPQLAAGRPHAFREARGQAAESRLDQAAVDRREESVEEAPHRLVHARLGARQEETHSREELAHGAGSLVRHAAVGLAEEDVGVVLCLPQQDLQGVCGVDMQDTENERNRRVQIPFIDKPLLPHRVRNGGENASWC